MKKEKSKKNQWTVSAWDMLYLAQCGVNSVVPDPERIAKMNLEMVYAQSKSQSLEVLTYMALESLMKSKPQFQIPDYAQVLAKWKEEKNKAIAKNLMMDAAREQLFAFLDKQGIWHMALKGVVLCHMYPKYGMRQMADNDIFFDATFRQEVHDWFVEQGYWVESFQKEYHDVYLKKPFYNFEMHTTLFDPSWRFAFGKYYLKIKDKLLTVPGKAFEYCMTDEDFYLYVLAHEYKHYSSDGTGLRFLLDLYVYHKSRNHMNWEYLNVELQKMGLCIFEKNMRELAQKILDSAWNHKDVTKREKMLIKRLFLGQTYGLKNYFIYNHAKTAKGAGNKISIKIKVLYLLHRIFPDRMYMEMWCQQYAPFLFRHQKLMPVALVWRVIKKGVEKRKQIKKELNSVIKS